MEWFRKGNFMFGANFLLPNAAALWLPEIVLPVCWCPLEMISKRRAQSSHEALFCALIFHMSSLFMQGRLASHKHVKTTLEMLLTASRCRTSELIPVDCGTRMETLHYATLFNSHHKLEIAPKNDFATTI